MDAWKGILKHKEQNTLYLQPCPDIENRHRRSKTCKNVLLMINGNSRPSLQTSKGLLKFRNTCAFDSVDHCIRAAYINCVTYRESVDELNVEILKIVKKLTTRGRVAGVYTMRAELLLPLNKTKDNVVKCTVNIGQLIENICSEVPSIVISKICYGCSFFDEV